MQIGTFGAYQRVVKGVVFLTRERAVKIIGIVALAVTCRVIRLAHVHAVRGYDWRFGVEEMQGAEQLSYAPVQRRERERSRRDDDEPVRDVLRRFVYYRYVAFRTHPLGHERGKTLSVHRERAARRHRAFVRGGKHFAPHDAKLCLEQSVRGGGVVAFERIAAHQLAHIVRGVSGAAAERFALDEPHGHAPVRESERGLTACQPSAYDGHLFHWPLFSPASASMTLTE